MNNQQFVNPRKETFFQMLKFTFCPTFTFYSFIFFVTMVDIVLYIITLLMTMFGNYSLDPFQFLGPSALLLDKFGAKDPYKMRYDLELWRFFTPMFLHASFLHILVSITLLNV